MNPLGLEKRNSKQSMIENLLNDPQNLQQFKQKKKDLFTKFFQKYTTKPLLKGEFYSFCLQQRKMINFYFEFHESGLYKFEEDYPSQFFECQHSIISQNSLYFGQIKIYSIQFSQFNETQELQTDNQKIHKEWFKKLSKICRQDNFLERFKIDQRLYEHHYRCVDKKKNLYKALRILNKKELKLEQHLMINSEINMLRNSNCILFPTIQKVYEDQGFIYIKFLYYHGEDLKQILSTNTFQETGLATVIYYIFKGLKQLHSKNYYHGNLKLENIIFSTQKRENEIILINPKYYEIQSRLQKDRLIRNGTNFCIAPEVLKGQPFNHQIDVFSIGCCIFYILFGRYPYKNISFDPNQNIFTYELDISNLESLKKDQKNNPFMKQQDNISISCIEFLQKTLEEDPLKRITAIQAVQHQWFINYKPKKNRKKKLEKFREQCGIKSLRTIVESSEYSDQAMVSVFKFEQSKSPTLFKKDQKSQFNFNKQDTMIQQKQYFGNDAEDIFVDGNDVQEFFDDENLIIKEESYKVANQMSDLNSTHHQEKKFIQHIFDIFNKNPDNNNFDIEVMARTFENIQQKFKISELELEIKEIFSNEEEDDIEEQEEGKNQ